MAGHEYATENKGPGRVYTPSWSSDEDMPRISNISLRERDYRLFSFKKEGRSWVNNLCSESTLSESEIKKRARRPRKTTHSVGHQLDKMSVPRKMAIEDLIERINRQDLEGDKWDIVAIDNDKPELTKRTGEVTAFSVILARIIPNRQRNNSIPQERRRSTSYISSESEFIVPTRRGSKIYGRGNTSPSRDDRLNTRQDKNYRESQTILEEDPFGNAQLFSNDGKPINASGAAAFTNAGLPPHIPLDEPIGAKGQTKDKEDKDKSKKPKGKKDSGVFDLDALLAGTDDVLVPGAFDDHDDDKHDFDYDNPIEIVDEHDTKPRGRKRSGSLWGEKTPKQGVSRSKSKSKPRRPSIHIPKDHYQRPITEVTPGNRRRQQPYWGSHGSATTQSIHSDQSILEAEYEEYSSSGSSAAEYADEWRGHYMPREGRYAKATNQHRRGPPSPHQGRYEVPGDVAYMVHRRGSRSERFTPNDTAVQRYTNYTPTAVQRPPLISHHSTPRFTSTPVSAFPPPSAAYSYEPAMTPYPSEMGTVALRRRPPPPQHHDSLQDAEMYIATERNRDREIELLQRERDVARREAEMHQEFARRASVSTRSGGGGGAGAGGERGSKYTYEPRSSRRYAENYHE